MTKRNTPARSTPNHLPPGLIEQYLFGKLPDRTRNRVERHLLECELCSDAVEGLSTQTSQTKTLLDVEELRTRLDKRVRGNQWKIPFGLQPFSVAASLILLVASTLAVWLTLQYQAGPSGNRDESLAQAESKPAAPPVLPAPEVAPAAPESDSMAPLISSNTQLDTIVPLKENQALASENSKLEEKEADSFKENQVAAVRPNLSEIPNRKQKSAISGVAVEKGMANSPAPVADSAEEEVRRTKSFTPLSTVAIRTKTVQGKVVDGLDGTTLPGVRVIVKGTEQSTLTDTYGNFSLQAPDTDTLVFQFVGMLPEEKPLIGINSLQIALKPDTAALNQVVVIGYGLPSKHKASFQDAKPQGGINQFSQYVKENLRLPDSVQVEKREAVVKVECVVMPDGSLTNFTIKKGAGDAFDREAIRVIQEGPKWEPAKEDGKAVPSRVTVKVPFKK